MAAMRTSSTRPVGVGAYGLAVDGRHNDTIRSIIVSYRVHGGEKKQMVCSSKNSIISRSHLQIGNSFLPNYCPSKLSIKERITLCLYQNNETTKKAKKTIIKAAYSFFRFFFDIASSSANFTSHRTPILLLNKYSGTKAIPNSKADSIL